MNKTSKVLILTILISFIFICISVVPSIATNHTLTSVSNTTDNSVTDSIDGTYEIISSDVYKFDETITINDIIDGNVFLFGKDISVSGEIGGDVFIFGAKVTITDLGNIHGNIFVFAQEFTMNGKCYDLYGATGKFNLGNDAIITRDLRLASEDATISGQIKRDAYMGVSNLNFDEQTASISGNLEYTSDTESNIPDKVVSGNVKYNPVIVEAEPSYTEQITSYISSIVSSLFYTLVIVLLVIWLTPKFVTKASNILKEKGFLAFGIGLLSIIGIVVIPLSLILFTYGIGFGIAIAAVTLFILALSISKSIFSIALAKILCNKLKKDSNLMFVLTSLLIILVLSLLQLIPILGSLASFVCSMIGLGIILINLKK